MRKSLVFLAFLAALALLAACGKTTPKAALPPQSCAQADECVPCGVFCINKAAFSPERCGTATHNACACEQKTCVVDQCQSDADCRACGTKCVAASYAGGGDCGDPKFSCMCANSNSSNAKSLCQPRQCAEDKDCLACAQGCIPASTLEVAGCAPDPAKACVCSGGKCAEK